MGYTPWGCKELDTTEQLTHTHSVEDKSFASFFRLTCGNFVLFDSIIIDFLHSFSFFTAIYRNYFGSDFILRLPWWLRW